MLTGSVGFLLPVRFLGSSSWFSRSDFVRRELLWPFGLARDRVGEGRPCGEVGTGEEAMGGQWVEEGMPPSNLQRFLDCTTPTVETHILPKVTQLPPVEFSPLMFLLVSGRRCHGLRRSAASREFRICHYSFLCTP